MSNIPPYIVFYWGLAKDWENPEVMKARKDAWNAAISSMIRLSNQ